MQNRIVKNNSSGAETKTTECNGSESGCAGYLNDPPYETSANRLWAFANDSQRASKRKVDILN